MIKVCSLSLLDSQHCDKYTTFAQLYSIKCKKRLDIPLTLLYTVYVDWVKGKELYKAYYMWYGIIRITGCKNALYTTYRFNEK